MSATTVTFGQTEFKAVGDLYGSKASVKRLVDALNGCGDNVEDDLSVALECRTALEDMAENGAGYTPDVSLGFGSDNSATIGSKILGRSTTAGATRKAFAKIGKV